MKHNLLIILIILPTILWGQSATFYADTTDLRMYTGYNKDLLKRVMEMEWRIGGHVLRFGSKPIKIKPDPNKIDTLFYKQNKNARWDTIICNIKEPLTYKFVYNTCCDGFNIAGTDNKFFNGKINFRLTGQTNKMFLGTLGEAGVLVTMKTTDTLLPGFRSAMSPNIYWVSFQEIKACGDPSVCKEDICLSEKGKKELNCEFKYRIISSKMKILFMPLSNDPLQVTYSTTTDKITIR